MREKEYKDYSILVVDDEETSLLLLREILQRSGFTPYSAHNGAEGLDIARVLRPDLIILDILLPDTDGFSVCARLKEDTGTKDIPVIFVTSLDDSHDKIRGLSIGGVDYITKPFDNDEILARVRIHLRLRDANRLIIESQKRKLAVLHDAHQSFLTDLAAIPDAKCRVAFEPAEEAGGDQYDAVRLGPSIYGYFVADIAGHGIESGFLSSVLKVLFRENATLLISPEDSFRRINTLMKSYLSDGQHITAAYLTINRITGTALLISAGHLPVIVAHPDGSLAELKAEGDILGTFETPLFRPALIAISAGTRFWMFSDGVVEDFEMKRSWKEGILELKRNIAATQGLSMAEALDRATEGLYSKHPGSDDRLLLLCEA